MSFKEQHICLNFLILIFVADYKQICEITFSLVFHSSTKNPISYDMINFILVTLSYKLGLINVHYQMIHIYHTSLIFSKEKEVFYLVEIT